ncbi:hypothetical protein PISL3812_06137 [Talaromyces islandicus]|uniref:Uncharacterized protein n=1 Tax=Talaromyces islandicus TaxID=28573 RepID=A0A0U1M108_TALIS|nr:hypothetical protein PISL3812_06137 [Talaromyces islandicus]
MSANEYFSGGGAYEQNEQHRYNNNSSDNQSPWSSPPPIHTPSSSTYEGSYPPSEPPYNSPQPAWGQPTFPRQYETQPYPTQSPCPPYQQGQYNSPEPYPPYPPYYAPRETYPYPPQHQAYLQQPPAYNAGPAAEAPDERGLLGAVAGGATGAFAGHQVHHGVLGAIGGAITGSVAEDAIKKHKKDKKERKEKKKWGHGRRDSSSSSSSPSSSSSDDEHHHHHHRRHSQENHDPNLRGNFSRSSNEIRLEGNYELVAYCNPVSGHPRRSSIPLNNVLTNTFGKFNWARGGNFGASARHIIGVSYVMTPNTGIEDVHIIGTWPGHGREAGSVWKVPSRLAYMPENQPATANAWGYQVTAKMKTYSWMKLLLDCKGPPTEYDDRDLKHSQGEGLLQLPPDTTATEICGNFLREIYNYTLEYLNRRLTAAVAGITDNPFRVLKVILAGGFGDTPYLNVQLKNWCFSMHNIELVCPENPQAAILEGAALSGLQGIKASKKNQSRGIAEYDPWDDHEKLCSSRDVWKTRKGQYIDEKTKFCQEIDVTTTDDEDPSFYAVLSSCTSEPLPTTYLIQLDIFIFGYCPVLDRSGPILVTQQLCKSSSSCKVPQNSSRSSIWGFTALHCAQDFVHDGFPKVTTEQTYRLDSLFVLENDVEVVYNEVDKLRKQDAFPPAPFIKEAF